MKNQGQAGGWPSQNSRIWAWGSLGRLRAVAAWQFPEGPGTVDRPREWKPGMLIRRWAVLKQKPRLPFLLPSKPRMGSGRRKAHCIKALTGQAWQWIQIPGSHTEAWHRVYLYSSQVKVSWEVETGELPESLQATYPRVYSSNKRGYKDTWWGPLTASCTFTRAQRCLPKHATHNVYIHKNTF